MKRPAKKSGVTQIAIRDVPPDVLEWIDAEYRASGLTKNEYLIRLLQRSREDGLTLPLFPELRREVVRPAALPFRFVDLFSGIGGMRIGLERVGGECVYSCEIDEHARITYHAWFGEWPEGKDIRKVDPEAVPDHDVLAAGFPCQPFSIAGVSKKKSLGRAHGFDDPTQGTMFFFLKEIIKAKRPPVLLLENVKNLTSHDRGKTWAVIHSTLDDLGYAVSEQIIDAQHWVPQHRERVFIIGLRRQTFGQGAYFNFNLSTPSTKPRLKEILEGRVDSKYTLSPKLWNYLQAYAEKHKAKGNGFGFGIADPNGVTRTLSARYFKDGSEILIAQKGKNPRRLTPTECRRLMGFPEDRPIVVSDTQAYRQFGNAVVPLVVEAVGRCLVETITRALRRRCLVAGVDLATGSEAEHVA